MIRAALADLSFAASRVCLRLSELLSDLSEWLNSSATWSKIRERRHSDDEREAA